MIINRVRITNCWSFSILLRKIIPPYSGHSCVYIISREERKGKERPQTKDNTKEKNTEKDVGLNNPLFFLFSPFNLIKGVSFNFNPLTGGGTYMSHFFVFEDIATID
jgi:hypothetical protein